MPLIAIVVVVLLGLYMPLTFVWQWYKKGPLITARQLDRTLLISISHLLEDAESALNSLEGEGVHRASPSTFARAKGKVTLAQTMVRNLLGVEQRLGRGGGVDLDAHDPYHI